MGDPPPTQTVGWASSVRSSSTRGTPCANGATAPGAKPVACSTSAGRAARAVAAPTALLTFSTSARRSPGTSTSTGRPSQRTTSDFTICPSEQPTASAASAALCALCASSSSRASAPAARR